MLESYSGAYTDLGIVYLEENKEKFADDIRNNLDFFLEHCQWIEIDGTRFENRDDWVKAYQTIATAPDFWYFRMGYQNSEKIFGLGISVFETEDQSGKGLVISIPEGQLLNESYSKQELIEVEQKIIEEIVSFSDRFSYDYIYCDQESLPVSREKMGQSYAILVTKDHQKIDVQLNEWHIDSLTGRDTKEPSHPDHIIFEKNQID